MVGEILSRTECAKDIRKFISNIEICDSDSEKEIICLEMFEYIRQDEVLNTFGSLNDEKNCSFRRNVCRKVIEFMKYESEFYLLNRHIFDHAIELYAFFPLEELLV